MLCESLVILLIKEGIIRKDQAADAIEAVIEVKQEIAGTTESVVVSMASIGLLRAMWLSIAAANVPNVTPASETTSL